jgi:hypothetical protein
MRRPWLIAGLFAGVGLLSCMPSSARVRPDPEPRISLSALDAETLPVELAGWRRLGFELARRGAGHADGEYSAIWRYERGGLLAIVSLDFPFVGWHHLPDCYRGGGRLVSEWHLEALPGSADGDELVAASLESERGRAATLLFAEWNSNGDMLEPPASGGLSWSRLLSDLKRRWARGTLGHPADCVYQFQVLIPRANGLANDEELLAIRQLFTRSLHILRQRTSTASGGVR